MIKRIIAVLGALTLMLGIGLVGAGSASALIVGGCKSTLLYDSAGRVVGEGSVCRNGTYSFSLKVRDLYTDGRCVRLSAITTSIGVTACSSAWQTLNRDDSKGPFFNTGLQLANSAYSVDMFKGAFPVAGSCGGGCPQNIYYIP